MSHLNAAESGAKKRRDVNVRTADSFRVPAGVHGSFKSAFANEFARPSSRTRKDERDARDRARLVNRVGEWTHQRGALGQRETFGERSSAPLGIPQLANGTRVSADSVRDSPHSVLPTGGEVGRLGPALIPPQRGAISYYEHTKTRAPHMEDGAANIASHTRKVRGDQTSKRSSGHANVTRQRHGELCGERSAGLIESGGFDDENAGSPQSETANPYSTSDCNRSRSPAAKQCLDPNKDPNAQIYADLRADPTDQRGRKMGAKGEGERRRVPRLLPLNIARRMPSEHRHVSYCGFGGSLK